MANEYINILRLLIENKKEKFSINKISKIRKINYKSAHTNIMKLIKNNLVNIEDYGNIKNCFFSRKFSPDVFRAEDLRRKNILKNKNLRVIYERINKIPGFFMLLLFGSYAKGKNKKGSDIDMALVCNNKKTSEKIENEISLIPLKIHFLNFTAGEFLSMLKSGEFNVGKEIAENNIILIGIEDYYRLIDYG